MPLGIIFAKRVSSKRFLHLGISTRIICRTLYLRCLCNFSLSFLLTADHIDTRLERYILYILYIHTHSMFSCVLACVQLLMSPVFQCWVVFYFSRVCSSHTDQLSLPLDHPDSCPRHWASPLLTKVTGKPLYHYGVVPEVLYYNVVLFSTISSVFFSLYSCVIVWVVVVVQVHLERGVIPPTRPVSSPSSAIPG